MDRLKNVLLSVLLIVFYYGAGKAHAAGEGELKGAWVMQSVSWVRDGQTYSIEKTQPGIFLFTENHYSIQWTPTQEPRVAFANLSNPSDEETIAGFRSVVFNSGTYIHTDEGITTTAFIAKVPGFEGGKQFYTYEISGDTLHITMVDETYPDGSKPEWSGKLVVNFVLSRAAAVKPGSSTLTP